jgi:alpha-ketoglutarate-dependent taurine dioxygenase
MAAPAETSPPAALAVLAHDRPHSPGLPEDYLADALAPAVGQAFRDGANAVSVPELGLAEVPLDRRRALLLALASRLGEPSPPGSDAVADVGNQAVGTRVPDPAVRPAGPDLEAEPHTDSALVPDPERYFLLYAVRAPRCGGAVRFLRDGRRVLARLAETAAGRDAVATLREVPLPMRVPKSLRGPGHTDEQGYYLAPVLGPGERWRWRRDKVEAGLAARPEHRTARVLAALEQVDRVLADPAEEIRLPIPDDALLLVDNHLTLHGRTGFTDTARHLLRIRYHG